jgi:phage tail-like protein
MPAREDLRPYGAFRFKVDFAAPRFGNGEQFDGHCSDVSGLGFEINYSEYRDGQEKTNTVRKVPNTFKVDEVTIKRGLLGSLEVYAWLAAVSRGEYQPRTVTISLYDEAGNPAATFKLTNAQPKKWVGPTLAAKGGGEVAMEELHLVHEGIEYS